MASSKKLVTSDLGAATTLSKSTRGTVSAEPDQSGSDDEPGNLVIDLNPSLERSPPYTGGTCSISGGKKSLVKSVKANTTVNNPFEHQSSVDRGLKMKIKRKTVGSSKSPDLPKGDKIDCVGSSLIGGGEKRKHPGSPLLGEKDSKISGKGRGVKKERANNKRTDSVTNGTATNLSSAHPSANSGVLNGVEQNGFVKRRSESSIDPYDFNAKTDDEKCPTGLFTKKIKIEKVDTSPSQQSPPVAMATTKRDISVETNSIGTVTEPECLGPCEPGTSVNLEGIVWQETENGMLVVNVTWRGKTFVGTLLDATKHDWAPPRLSCDSPVSDLDQRGAPKGRGKRARATSSNVPLSDVSSYSERKLRKGRRGSGANFQAPPSPAKSDASAPSTGSKRKGRPAELDLSSSNEDLKLAKRSRSCSRSTPVPEPSPSSPALIECPEPNCNKKYKHINGLRYHQTHAHLDSEQPEETAKDTAAADNSMPAPSPSPPAAKEEKEAVAKDTEPAGTKKRGAKKKEASVERSRTPAVENKSEDKPTADNAHVKEDGVKKSNLPIIKPKKDVTVSVSAVASSETVSEAKTISTATGTKNATPQVFHISGAPLGCLNTTVNKSTVHSLPSGSTVVAATVSAPTTFLAPQTSGHLISTVATLSVPVVTVATMVAPVATITPPVVSESFKSDINSASKDKKMASKADKFDKGKQKSMANRPIVPAPAAKMLNATVSVTQSTLAPVSTYTPVSSVGTSALKPIQPKPTIMGETTTVNPLAGLKDKRVKKKRNRDLHKLGRDGEGGIDSGKGTNKQDVNARPAPPALIPSKPVEIAPKPAPGTIAVQKIDTKEALTTGVPKTKKVECSRTVIPPTSLNIGCSLKVSTQDNNNASANTDGMTSPAYSDISDEGAPSLDNESGRKSSEVKLPSEAQAKETPTPNVSAAYGMYPYYVQPPHLIPAVSPASRSPRSREQSVERTSNDANKSSSGVKIKKEPPDSLREFPSKSGAPTSSNVPPSGDGKSASGKPDDAHQQAPSKHQQQLMLQQEMFLQQQQILQQQLLAAGIPPQAHYQYLYYLANDPQYRMRCEQVIEEHQQAMRERDMAQLKEAGDKGGDGGAGASKMATPEDVKKESRPTCSDDGRKTSSDKTPTSQPSSLERNRTERSMQEKLRESHQIMRENIELKSQVESAASVATGRLSKPMDPYDTAQLVKKQEEDLQRFYMFQRQQMLEQKKVHDSSKQPSRPDGAGGSAPRNVPELKPIDDSKPKVSASATLGSIAHERSPRASPNKLRREEARSDKSSPDPVKRQDRQKSATPLAGKPVSRADTPKSARSPPGMQSIASQQSPAAAFPVFAAANPYHYAPFDVGHPMYRAPTLMGYNPAGYIHPSQMRYHVSPMEAEKDKATAMLAGAKSLDPAYFSPAGQHKIHELKEQAKSPVTSTGEKSSSSTTDSSTGSPFEKRRDSSSPPAQRHLHTHHHTHVAYPLYADPYMLTGQPSMPFGPKP